MDWSKYPLDRLVYFIAGLVPGFTALLIFQLSHPNSFSWFFTLPYFGYRTKLTLLTLAAFVIGYSASTILSTLLNMLGGAVGGALAAWRPPKNPEAIDAAPWRDPRWRSALQKYLGKDAPENTFLITQPGYDFKLKLLKDRGTWNPMSVVRLDLERDISQTNDLRWQEWYSQFHEIVLNEQSKEWMTQVRYGLDFNLKTTALLLLISARWVPQLIHWWCILPAILWTFLFVTGEASSLMQYTSKWTTLNAQIKYLLDLQPLSQGQSLLPES